MKILGVSLTYIIIGIFLIFGIGGAIHYAKDQIVPPIESTEAPYLHKGDGSPANIFHPGEALFVRAFTKRLIDCQANISYTIMQSREQADGIKYRKFWYIYLDSSVTTSAGRFVTDDRRILPDWLPPGDYLMARSANYNCNGVTIIAKTRPIPFTVILPMINDKGSSQ